MQARLAVLFLGPALLLAGCAEEDAPVSGAKAAVVEQGDPICAAMRDAVGTLGDEPEKDRDAIQAGVDQLEAIPAPDEDAQTLKLMLIRIENAALAMEDANQAGIQKDGARAQKAVQTARDNDEAARGLAETYGFVECAQGIEASS